MQRRDLLSWGWASRCPLGLRHGLAASVANVEDLHRVAINGEEDPICVGLAAIEKLPHFERKTRSFRSKWATLRKFSKRRNSVVQHQKPANTGLAGVL